MSWAKLELIAKLEMIIMSQLWEMDKITDNLILKGAWCHLESFFLSLDLLALLTLIGILYFFLFLVWVFCEIGF